MNASRRIFPVATQGLIIVISLCIGAGLAVAQPATRDLTPTTRSPQEIVTIEGEYWALIIGIDQYQHAPPLSTAVKDAKGIRDVLVQRYGFQPDHVVMLLDGAATRSNIEGALIRMGSTAKPADSVLIYYGGHGQYSEDHRLGWWVPVEGRPDQPGSYILDANVRTYVASMQARHVYLIADSCFSGTLFANRRSVLPPVTDKYYSRLYAKKSRWGFTSGGTEPVADQGREGHSIFAYHLIKFLNENTEPYLVPSHIEAQVSPLVANNSDQVPLSRPLQGANDEGGQFVLRLASVAGTLERQEKEVEDRLGRQGQEELERLKQEQDKLAEERRRFEEERLAEERRREQGAERLRSEVARLDEVRLNDQRRRDREAARLRVEQARLKKEREKQRSDSKSEYEFSGGF